MLWKRVIVYVTILERLVTCVAGFRWLALAMSSTGSRLTDESDCSTLHGLVEKQKKVCRKNVDLMPAIADGAQVALDECQHQFRHRRWNCSTVDASSLFGRSVSLGTRETAFVHAVSAAGVAHAVTRTCSLGDMDRCGCDRTVTGQSPQGFNWAGCSDNIAFGTAFSRSFVDVRERIRSKQIARALMNLHNNEAGRRVIEYRMKTQCKCHGVSGSCEMKTCWKAMPSFREIGLSLKEKFDGATEVVLDEKARKLVPYNSEVKPHTEEDLIYMATSPDYCDYDLKVGSLGTTGRACNKTSRGLDGCDLMCCGRGYDVIRRTVTERCRCKFQWCCHVTCQTCKREQEVYFCR